MSKIKVTFENFTRLDRKSLEMIYKWRTSEDIANRMDKHKASFSLEEHLQFCESLKERKDKLYCLIKYDGHPCGVYDYVNIEQKQKKATFGVYLIKDFQKYASVITFMQLFVCKKHSIVYANYYVRKDNVKAVLFNAVKLKHKIVSEDDDYYYFESEYFEPTRSHLSSFLDKYEYEILD